MKKLYIAITKKDPVPCPEFKGDRHLTSAAFEFKEDLDKYLGGQALDTLKIVEVNIETNKHTCDFCKIDLTEEERMSLYASDLEYKGTICPKCWCNREDLLSKPIFISNVHPLDIKPECECNPPKTWCGKLACYPDAKIGYMNIRSALDTNVNHPPHYTNSKATCECGKTIECIEVTRHMNFNLGNAIKYIWRADHKGKKIEDLKKAIWYLQDEIKNSPNEFKITEFKRTEKKDVTDI